MKHPGTPRLSRRRAAQLSLAGIAAGVSGASAVRARSGLQESRPAVAFQAPHDDLVEMPVIAMRAALDSGELTSRELVNMYLARIEALDQHGPTLRSVLELNPDAVAIAAAMDEELSSGQSRSPLHGIPVLLKDNIDTADRMHTTAGSLALMASTPAQDATVVTRLRDAGAVILGKTNLTEWANFRGFQASNGWSARGGQTRNPYALDRSPSGSSSGSAVAVSANLTAIAIGTETNGSIVSPAAVNGVVGLKPTVGLTSRAGVIPISATQDSVGVLGRTVEDAALTLGVMTGPDPRDPMTDASQEHALADYAQYLDASALQGARIGVPRNAGFNGYSPETDAIFESVLYVLRSLGAEIVDEADIPTMEALNEVPGSFERLQFEFKRDLNRYLEERQDPEIVTLADLIAFNERHREAEMTFFQQEIFELSEAFTDEDIPEYEELIERLTRQAGPEGIDAVLQEHDLDALVAPAFGPSSAIDLVNGDQFLGASSGVAAMAGYPLVAVPMGHAFGLPLGLTFMGTAFSEPTLLGLAYAFEQATMARRPPTYRPDSLVSDGSLTGIEPATGADTGTPDAGDATPQATPAM